MMSEWLRRRQRQAFDGIAEVSSILRNERKSCASRCLVGSDSLQASSDKLTPHRGAGV
jgi:hypothetical protein